MTNIVKLLLEKDLDNMPQIDKAYSIQKVDISFYLYTSQGFRVEKSPVLQAQ